VRVDRRTVTAKGYEGRRPRTWALITAKGERALGDEMALLAGILENFRRKR
jgi:hypothetical protein